MLDPRSWVDYCDRVVRGRSRKFPHTCGEGRPLNVTHFEDGSFRAWCHRCREDGYKPPPVLSLTERLEIMAQAANKDRQAQSSVDLPVPMVRDVSQWPEACLLWLLKAGLSTADIGKLKAYYHPPTGRVVLPIYAGEKVIFWQARAVEPWRVPKYLSPDMGLEGKGKVVPKFGSASQVTLTEDVLSAYKVGTVSEGWSMMGTSASRALVAELLKRNCPVNVWLDPDPAGRKAAMQVVKQLRGYGLEVRNIQSPRDPKLMWRSQIKDLLCGHSST